jgi:hypothetical protein
MGLVNSVTTRASSAISYVATNVSYGFTQTVSFGGRAVQQLPSAGYNAFQMTRSAAQSVVPSSLFGRVAAGAGLLVVAVVVYRFFINTPAAQIEHSKKVAAAASANANAAATAAGDDFAAAKANLAKLPGLIDAEKEAAKEANAGGASADAGDFSVSVPAAAMPAAQDQAAPAEDDRLAAARAAVEAAEAAITLVRQAASNATQNSDRLNPVAAAAAAAVRKVPTQADADDSAKIAKTAQECAAEAAKQAAIVKTKAAEVAAIVASFTTAA